MAVGDLVVCPICVEVAVIRHEIDEWPEPYFAIVDCEECGNFEIITKPTKVDTLKIEYPKPDQDGQQEFGFVDDETKHPGKPE